MYGRSLRSFVAVAASLVLALPASLAHSTARNPISRVDRIDSASIRAPSDRIHSSSSFELSFHLVDEDRDVRLSLTPSHDLFAEGATLTFLEADGSLRYQAPVDTAEHRVFRGEAFTKDHGRPEWHHAGWARISVTRDGLNPIFEGAFQIAGDNHHIQSRTTYMNSKHAEDPAVDESGDEFLVVWRDSDILPDAGGMTELKRDLTGRGHTCMSDGLEFNSDENHPVYTGFSLQQGMSAVPARSLFGRQSIDGTTGGNGAGVNLANSIGSTRGCFNTRRVALLGVATDCTYASVFKNDVKAIQDNLVKQLNTASQLYESSFNITLAIQNLTILPEGCPAQPAASAPWNVGCGAADITQRLNLFSQWRGQSLDSNAFWTLMSTCNTDAAVGLAWLGQVCSRGSQTAQSQTGSGNETIAGANVVVRTPNEWQVIAHEIGHTFGAVHDCTSGTCSDGTVTKQQCCPFSASQCNAQGRFIMNPSTGNGITAFSPCSIGNICSAIGRQSVKTECLTNNKDVRTITGSQCGNGIVEAGEDCDCGGEATCGNNPCCDAKTCKFKGAAKCDPSNEDCCTAQCDFAPSSTVCRASTGECDPEERCTGNTPLCPKDVTAPDGQTCSAGQSGPSSGLACASGQCTSRDQQCKTLMGAVTSLNDTYACSNQGCQLMCTSSRLQLGQCIGMMQNFLDGTPCQGGGKCVNGDCQGASIVGEIGGWFNSNKHIAIPVIATVGGLIVLAIACCIFSKCRRSRRARRAAPNPSNSWGSGVGMAHPRYGNGGEFYQPGASRSEAAMASGGAGVPTPPPMQHGNGMYSPPPVYTPYGQQAQGWGQFRRQSSMRYA